MDIHQFLKEYRSFRQKVGEELGIADEELVLKFFLAFKRLQRLNENPFKNYSQIFDSIMNPRSKINPDSEDNDDDPFSNDSGTNPYYPFR
tara:strand:- start:117 stop:386 length:270 start_codon:yes stop_codon:yes gene_type:complete